MGLYLGDKKITGTGIQVDDALSTASHNPVENSVISSALEDIGYYEWQKPSDWVDIRSGAQDNSIYLLVAHSTPTESGGTYTVATYPELHLTCRVSTAANSYDVYVDGVKVSTTASASKATIAWGALYTAGTVRTIYTTTHPSSLVYHVVRITPSVSTDTLTRFQNTPDSSNTQQGILWAHFQLSNAITIVGAFGGEQRPRNLLLEAVTAKNNKITYTVASSTNNSGFYLTFAYCQSLVQLPVLEAESQTYGSGQYMCFHTVPAKKVIIRNNKGTESLGILNHTRVQEIDIENGTRFYSAVASGTAAHTLPYLKRLPTISTSAGEETLWIYCASSLEDTFIDDTADTSRKVLRINGTSTAPTRGLKGLIVSSSAPFDGASPQIDISYSGLARAALVALFNSLPTVTASQVCNITSATGAADLTASDLAIATGKGWTVTR